LIEVVEGAAIDRILCVSVSSGISISAAIRAETQSIARRQGPGLFGVNHVIRNASYLAGLLNLQRNALKDE
jgi:hypothetical protein